MAAVVSQPGMAPARPTRLSLVHALQHSSSEEHHAKNVDQPLGLQRLCVDLRLAHAHCRLDILLAGDLTTEINTNLPRTV